jgi:hypothetical protein
MQDLGDRGAHARSLSGREHDRQGSPARHPVPSGMMTKLRCPPS